jgi:hypothetical protein
MHSRAARDKREFDIMSGLPLPRLISTTYEYIRLAEKTYKSLKTIKAGIADEKIMATDEIKPTTGAKGSGSGAATSDKDKKSKKRRGKFPKVNRKDDKVSDIDKTKAYTKRAQKCHVCGSTEHLARFHKTTVLTSDLTSNKVLTTTGYGSLEVDDDDDYEDDEEVFLAASDVQVEGQHQTSHSVFFTKLSKKERRHKKKKTIEDSRGPIFNNIVNNLPITKVIDKNRICLLIREFDQDESKIVTAAMIKTLFTKLEGLRRIPSQADVDRQMDLKHFQSCCTTDTYVFSNDMMVVKGGPFDINGLTRNEMAFCWKEPEINQVNLPVYNSYSELRDMCSPHTIDQSVGSSSEEVLRTPVNVTKQAAH